MSMNVEHETAILVERFAASQGITPDVAASFFVYMGASTLSGKPRRLDVRRELAIFLASMGVSTQAGA